MARQRSYHHGDLRQALIDTGLDMLEEQGLEGLTLRKLAARVGVSHAAPEHHFPTLRHLLTAFAVEGFRLFAASMREAMVAAPGDPAEQLRAASRGYLNFARARPHLFRLMFTANRLDWDDPTIGPPANAAHAVRITGARQIDLSSGVESAPGVKDPALIRALAGAVGLTPRAA